MKQIATTLTLTPENAEKMEGCKVKRNKHEGSSFDDFLRDEGVYEDVEATAVMKVIVMIVLRCASMPPRVRTV